MRALFLTFWILLLANCAPPSSEPNAGLSAPPATHPDSGGHAQAPAAGAKATRKAPSKAFNQVQIVGSFDPNTVELICQSGAQCPTAAGVLIFEMPLKPGAKLVDLQVCTASLIEQGDRVLTAGHCDYFDKAVAAYFVTRADIPGGKRIARVTKMIFKNYAPPPPPPPNDKAKVEEASEHLWPDAEVMALNEIPSGITPFKLANGPPPKIPSLRAWVVQNAADVTNLTLAPLDCVLHRDASFFPYDITEAPNLLRAFDCAAVGGNSGSAMVYDGKVEAVVGNKNDSPDPKVRKHLLATNVRCLDYPVQSRISCAQVSRPDEQSRLDAATAVFNEKLNSKTVPTLVPGKNFAFQIRSYEIAGQNGHYQVFAYPTCHGPNWDQKSIPIYTSLAYIDHDDWNNKRLLHEGDRVTNVGTVKTVAGDVFTADWQWTAPALRFIESVKNPRTVWSGTSAIEIPPCAR